MKKMVCELCGETDFMKRDGFFECLTCGMKYSLEEARKLFQEINSLPEKETVEQGTPDVVSEQEYQNLVKNADATYESGNYETAYQLYTSILNIDPEDVHCVFKRALSSFNQTNLQKDRTGEFVIEIERAFRLKHNECGDSRFYYSFCADALKEIEVNFKNMAKRFAQTNLQILLNKLVFLAVNGAYIIYFTLSNAADYSNSDEKYWGTINSFLETCSKFMKNIKRKPDRDFERYANQVKKIEKGAKERIAARRERNLKAYWNNHEADRIAINVVKDQIRVSIAELEKSKESIEEKTEIKNITDELAIIEGELKKLKAFDIKERNRLKEQQGNLWDQRRDARSRAEKHIEDIDALIAKENEKIHFLDIELTRDRWPDEEDGQGLSWPC